MTDDQFRTDSIQSFRERNWFGVPWNIFSLNFDSKINANFDVSVKAFGLVGERNSVGFVGAATVPDAISTNQYGKRQVDSDIYKNLGVENRNLYRYNLGKIKNNLAFGVRLYQANTERFQKGVGTTGSDFDMTIEGRYPTALTFTAKNVALFAENQFKINDQFTVTPGVRFEHIFSTSNGRINISSGKDDTFAEKALQGINPFLALALNINCKKQTFMPIYHKPIVQFCSAI